MPTQSTAQITMGCSPSGKKTMPRALKGSVTLFALFSALPHKGAPMGAATVAQRVGDALYIGSFAGDRLLRVEPPQAALTPLALQNP